MTWTNVTNPTVDGFIKVTNPSNNSISISAGNPIGLLLALTYASSSSISTNPWTNVTNPSSSSWTKVTNP